MCNLCNVGHCNNGKVASTMPWCWNVYVYACRVTRTVWRSSKESFMIVPQPDKPHWAPRNYKYKHWLIINLNVSFNYICWVNILMIHKLHYIPTFIITDLKFIFFSRLAVQDSRTFREWKNQYSNKENRFNVIVVFAYTHARARQLAKSRHPRKILMENRLLRRYCLDNSWRLPFCVQHRSFPSVHVVS